jgi:hypothetical protein
MLNRRHFLQATSAAVVAAQTGAKRIAIVADAYPRVADRFLLGYPWAGAWRKPGVQVVAMSGGGDLAAARAQEHGFRVYSTVAETLRCGSAKLAVDGVVVVGGGLAACVEVFEAEGRGVPVFVEGPVSRRVKFPMLAGSALPVTWRLPSIELPLGSEIESAVMVGVGGRDFDAIEAMQCMVERRRGGETGVKAVQRLAGDDVWKADYPRELLAAALSRSDTPMGLTVTDGRTQDLMKSGELEKLAKTPSAYRVEYRDGLVATVLMLDGAVKDFNFAARVKGGKVWSTQFLVTPEPSATYEACLVEKAARMFETGVAPWPIERTLLTSAVLAGSGLAVSYRAPRESVFAQG